MDKTNHTCRECGEEADEQHTIKFAIPGFKDYHYCSLCGVVAKELEKMVDELVSAEL